MKTMTTGEKICIDLNTIDEAQRLAVIMCVQEEFPNAVVTTGRDVVLPFMGFEDRADANNRFKAACDRAARV